MTELKVMENVDINGREFTRILGGFREDSIVVSDKQIADLLGYSKGARQVRVQLDNNIKHFEYGLDIIDLKGVHQMDTLDEQLISLGYSKQAITQSEHIYIFSEAGFLLYLKFAEGDKAVELYKDFIEKYFKTKAQKILLEITIQEELEFLKDTRAITLGRMFMAVDDDLRRQEYFLESERLNNEIHKIENRLSTVKALDSVKSELAIAETFTQSNGTWDIGVVAKILNIKGLGRNNFFEWMRNKKIIMKDSTIPYQTYMKYFEVKPVVNKYNGFVNEKSLFNSKGIKFIMDKLIEDGKVVSKTYEQVMKELSGN